MLRSNQPVPDTGIWSGRISAPLVDVGAGEVGKDEDGRGLGSLHLRNAILIFHFSSFLFLNRR